MDRLNSKELILPLIPLRELVAFPTVIVPILVGRDKSVNALKASLASYGGYIFLAAQKNQVTESPLPEEMYETGTIAKIEKSAEQNNGSYRIVVQGLKRGQHPPLCRQPRFLPGAARHPGRARRERQGPAGAFAQPDRPVRGIHQFEAGAPAGHHDPAQAQPPGRCLGHHHLHHQHPLEDQAIAARGVEHLCPRRPRVQYPEKGGPAAEEPAGHRTQAEARGRAGDRLRGI